MKILYDYDAAAPGEISAKEDEVMLAFTQEDDWLLVQAQDDDRAGYVPANYVETVSAEELPSPSHGVIVPPSVCTSLSVYTAISHIFLYSPHDLSVIMQTRMTS